MSLAHGVTDTRKDCEIFLFDCFRDLREPLMAHDVPLTRRRLFNRKREMHESFSGEDGPLDAPVRPIAKTSGHTCVQGHEAGFLSKRERPRHCYDKQDLRAAINRKPRRSRGA